MLNRHVVAAGPPAQVLTVHNLQVTFGGTTALHTALGQSA
jgi:ABC-type Mn2+/Zn2+ transport system ATPase subunit